jgi:hypothetical protein
MKFFIILSILLTSIFAGGEFSTSQYERLDKKKIEKIEKAPKYRKLAVGYIKPKCEDCGEPAELMPYNGVDDENLPEAETYPCPDDNECMNYMG